MVNVADQIVQILSVIAIFGIGTSIACDPERIRACGVHAKGVEHSTQVTPEVCNAVKEVSDCFKRETSTCGPEMKNVQQAAMQSFAMIENLCSNPDQVIPDLASCDTKKFKMCGKQVQKASQSASTAEEKCRALDMGLKCVEDLKKGCKHEGFQSIADAQVATLAEPKQKCQDQGYSFGGSESSSSNGNENEKVEVEVEVQPGKAMQGGADKKHMSAKQDSNKDNNNNNNNNKDNNNNNNDNSDDDDGGAGTVQPMFFTLAASAAFVIFTYFHRIFQ